MIPVSHFMDKIEPRLCGCHSARIKSELLDAMHDFCKDTQAWQEWLPDIDLADETTVLIPQPAHGHAITILDVRCNGASVIDHLNDSQVTQIEGGILAGNTVDCDGPLGVKVALTVLPDETEVPDMFWYRYRDVIIDGALSRLYSQLNKSWGNAELAVVHSREYRDGLATVRGDVVHGFNSTPMRATASKLVGMP